MPHQWYQSVTPEGDAAGTGGPHISRVYNYLLGGKDNFEADREAAERILTALPEAAICARAQRAFLGRAVHHLASEAGIRQFLDIGTGLPAAGSTHEVAQQAAAESRVAYVDNDPIVLAYARALLTGSPEGGLAYIYADLRDTDAIAQEAGRFLDFTQPAAVMLVGILQCIPDEDNPAAIVTRLMAAMAPGSYLVVAHPAIDIAASQMCEALRDYNRKARVPLTARTRAEVCRFFNGLDLVEPGVAQVHRWRPLPGDLEAERDLASYCGMARKR